MKKFMVMSARPIRVLAPPPSSRTKVWGWSRGTGELQMLCCVVWDLCLLFTPAPVVWSGHAASCLFLLLLCDQACCLLFVLAPVMWSGTLPPVGPCSCFFLLLHAMSSGHAASCLPLLLLCDQARCLLFVSAPVIWWGTLPPICPCSCFFLLLLCRQDTLPPVCPGFCCVLRHAASQGNGETYDNCVEVCILVS